MRRRRCNSSCSIHLLLFWCRLVLLLSIPFNLFKFCVRDCKHDSNFLFLARLQVFLHETGPSYTIFSGVTSRDGASGRLFERPAIHLANLVGVLAERPRETMQHIIAIFLALFRRGRERVLKGEVSATHFIISLSGRLYIR